MNVSWELTFLIIGVPVIISIILIILYPPSYPTYQSHIWESGLDIWLEKEPKPIKKMSKKKTKKKSKKSLTKSK